MKRYLIAFLSGLAVALGTGFFLVWKLLTHRRNLEDAQDFLEINSELSNKIEKDMELKETEFNKKAEEIRTLHEELAKEDIIEKFKGIFGVPTNP